uniref:NADH dehydrogenase subunit 5 n=1 Tax=Nisia atrovenosa TaxID=1187023 RepID=UPI002A7F1AC2|nr:NADH dehydrogenase subunit 5 [Nisia atrovenosa]WOW98925.1 NADH dehydrogenase subunit 5 [Nisia atrovenosa]
MNFSMTIFFFFFFFFLMLFLFSIYFYLVDLSMMFEWVYLIIGCNNYSLIFYFDWISMIFLSFIFLISGCVLFYSIDYMWGDLNFIRFYFLVFMFIFSMILLIICPDMFCMILGWDGLGLVSYILVMYYQNNISLSSSILTVMSNRVGDLFLILGICYLINLNSWHYMFYLNNNFILNLIYYFCFFSSITKSAQFPFMSWLPCAMAAPTPVSSLVHSSTLVTSGVYFLIRFNLFLNNFFSSFIMIISLLTIFISGLGACMENDLKKIIAFSTLSQLGLMFFSISLGMYHLSFIHLLIHAVFKSLLFLCSGFYIHCVGGSQDIRLMGSFISFYPFVSSMFLIGLLSLMGFPFFCGFYSKDFIIELFCLMNLNMMIFILFCFGMGLTILYSYRLCYYIFFGKIHYFKMMNFSSFFYMKFSMIFLGLMGISSGSFLLNLFNDLFMVILDDLMIFISLILLFIFFFFGFFFINLMLKIKGYMMSLISSMFFLNYFSQNFFSLNLFLVNLYVNEVEKKWMELPLSIMFKFLKFVFSFFDSLSYNYMIYFFCLFFIYLFIFLNIYFI